MESNCPTCGASLESEQCLLCIRATGDSKPTDSEASESSEHQHEYDTNRNDPAGSATINNTLSVHKGGRIYDSQIIQTGGGSIDTLVISLENAPKRRTYSIFERVVDFPRTAGGETVREQDLPDLDSVIEHRVLLLSYSNIRDSHLSFRLAELLEVSRENIKLASVHRLKDHSDPNPLSIDSLSFDREGLESDGRERDVVIVLDALTVPEFVESLLDPTPSSYFALLDELKRNRIYLICLLPDETLRAATHRRRGIVLPHWIIPSELDATSINEAATELDKLLSADDVVVKTLIFVASFFPHLGYHDFDLLVNLWLAKEAPVTPEKATLWSPLSSHQTVRPIDAWLSRPDHYLTRCHLQLERSALGNKALAFCAPLNERVVRDEFLDNHPSFVLSRLATIRDFNLIFDASDSISNRAIHLLAEFFADLNEETSRWIFEIVTGRSKSQSATSSRDGSVAPQRDDAIVINRLSILLREILRQDDQRETVKNILEDLIRAGAYWQVFGLSKRLRRTPEFDRVHWIKQLLERGDKEIREAIRIYLLRWAASTSIYEVLDRTSEWLSDRQRCSSAGASLLDVVFAYCIVTANKFSEEAAGREPTTCPMFQFRNVEVAEDSLRNLVGCLLHPELENVLPSEIEALVADLFERWATILWPGPEPMQGDDSTSGDNLEQVENREVLRILVFQIAAIGSTPQHDLLLASWGESKNRVTVLIESEMDFRLRRALSHRRSSLRALISTLKEELRFVGEKQRQNSERRSEENSYGK